jgi:predicted transcriptional regulator
MEEGEYVEADVSLCEAIHMLVMGQHQRLLVLSEGEIVGVLRLSDVFMKVFELMKQCEIGME